MNIKITEKETRNKDTGVHGILQSILHVISMSLISCLKQTNGSLIASIKTADFSTFGNGSQAEINLKTVHSKIGP